MILHGTIELKGPGLKRQELSIDLDDDGLEKLEVLTTKVDKGKEIGRLLWQSHHTS